MVDRTKKKPGACAIANLFVFPFLLLPRAHFLVQGGDGFSVALLAVRSGGVRRLRSTDGSGGGGTGLGKSRSSSQQGCRGHGCTPSSAARGRSSGRRPAAPRIFPKKTAKKIPFSCSVVASRLHLQAGLGEHVLVCEARRTGPCGTVVWDSGAVRVGPHGAPRRTSPSASPYPLRERDRCRESKKASSPSKKN